MGKLDKSLNNEKFVLETFKRGTKFYRNDGVWTVVLSGKPRVQKGSGEPKTDVFARLFCISGEKTGQKEDYKISIKRTDYNFLENKVSWDKMVEIFGEDRAREILYDAVNDIIDRNRESMEEDASVKENVIRKKGEQPTNRYNIGYRCDITNKANGNRSAKLELTDEEKKRILSGGSMPEEKRNAVVGGGVVDDSGVANYFLEVDLTGPTNIDDLIKKCKTLNDKELYDSIDFYITLKAVNYYGNGKYDGNRPLAVYTSYDEEFKPTIMFDKERSLVMRANERVNVLKEQIERRNGNV